MYFRHTMKRILVFTLLFVYTTLACGVNIQLHYCGGKIKYISLFAPSDDEGCCGSSMKKKDCCDDKEQYLKVKDKHNSNASLKIVTFKGQISDFTVPYFTYNFHYNTHECIIENYHAPPVLYDNPLYLKHRVLII